MNRGNILPFSLVPFPSLSPSLAQKLLLDLQTDLEPLLLILHEKTFRDVESVSLDHLEKTTTTEPPLEEDSNLSKVRILVIIFGTVLIFSFGAYAISCCRKVARKATGGRRVVKGKKGHGSSSSSPVKEKHAGNITNAKST